MNEAWIHDDLPEGRDEVVSWNRQKRYGMFSFPSSYISFPSLLLWFIVLTLLSASRLLMSGRTNEGCRHMA